MKKIMIRAMALILAAILVLSLVPVALAAENINFGIDVTPGTDKITVNVAEGNDAAFAELAKENKLFALTVDCDFSNAYVTFGGNVVESRLDTTAKTIQFAVAKSGEYQILKGEAPKEEEGGTGGSAGSGNTSGSSANSGSAGSSDSSDTTTSSTSQSAGNTVTTVPVQGDDKTVRVEVSVSGSVASLEKASANQVKAVVNDKVQTGTVTVDLSRLNKNIDSAKIPADMLKQIADASHDSENDTDGLEIILSKGTSVELDGEALKGVVSEAGNQHVTISVKDHRNVRTLTAAQKTAVGSRPAYDVKISVNGTAISNIGGRITIRVPYSLKAGEKAEGLRVYYVDNAGNREACETSYSSQKKQITWHTNHLSLYVIDYEEPAAIAEAAT